MGRGPEIWGSMRYGVKRKRGVKDWCHLLTRKERSKSHNVVLEVMFEVVR